MGGENPELHISNVNSSGVRIGLTP